MGQSGLEPGSAPAHVNPVDFSHLGDATEDDARSRAAECDALASAADDELRRVIVAWPSLPPPVRAQIVAITEASTHVEPSSHSSHHPSKEAHA